eukprot:TRINITY_DN40740_c0_g1_i1.p1 TRINITY_DN40740_c0_g1~~TRINITY_DN40740_c0_g1_i1.p1  ORF type:complete len:165 (+),score=43.11 TRINITY_DN40740_c0_g1_i1:59-496(+)
MRAAAAWMRAVGRGAGRHRFAQVRFSRQSSHDRGSKQEVLKTQQSAGQKAGAGTSPWLMTAGLLAVLSGGYYVLMVFVRAGRNPPAVTVIHQAPPLQVAPPPSQESPLIDHAQPASLQEGQSTLQWTSGPIRDEGIQDNAEVIKL